MPIQTTCEHSHHVTPRSTIADFHGSSRVGFSLSSRLFLKLTSMKDVSPWLIIQFPMMLSALSSPSLGGGSLPASSACCFISDPPVLTTPTCAGEKLNVQRMKLRCGGSVNNPELKNHIPPTCWTDWRKKKKKTSRE